MLVRHAQPDWEPLGRACDDPLLTAYGHQQAEALAQWLAPQSFDGFFVSPTRRTLQTSQPVSQFWNRQATVLPWLEEIRTPHLDGTPEDEVKAFIASARNRPLQDWWTGLPGGESFHDFHQRVTSGLDAFLSEVVQGVRHNELWQFPSQPRRHLLVAHLGTISVLLSHLLQIPPVPWEWERFPLSWAGTCVVRTNPVADGHIWALQHFNQVHHLEHLAWTSAPS